MAEPVTTLPCFIALKGDNEMFLALKPDGLLTFDATTMSRLTTHEVLYNLDDEVGTFIIRSQNNRFWRRDDSNWIRADHEGIPESSATLTRFKLADLGSGKLALRSATDDLYLKRLTESSYDGYNASSKTPDAYTGVQVSDASEQAVRLPRYVYFKGDNGKYLHVHADTNQLSYQGQDPGNLAGISEVFYMLNGAIALYNPQKGRFWREFPDPAQPLVLAQATSDIAMNPSSDDCHFEPTKLGRSITALRCKRSNKLCKRQTGLSADNLQTLGTSTSDTATHMTLTQAILGSHVFDVNYLLKFASTTEVSPIAVADGSMINSSPFMTNLNVVVTIRHNLTKSRSFSNSFTFSQSVSTTFTAGIPFFADGTVEVQVGFQQNFSNEWSETKEEEIQYQTEYLVRDVPPGGTAQVSVVASTAKMQIPFTYKCKDTAPDGTDRPTETRIDGIFDGVDAYKIEAIITGSIPSYTVPAKFL